MKKPQVNYAFIDGNNLNLSINDLGWKLDYHKFRVYLSEHYGVTKAYYFIGYMPKYSYLYKQLESAGYSMVYKEISLNDKKEIKGNVDSDMVLQIMLDINRYEKAILISSDGDFASVVNFLKNNNKLECVLAPNNNACSHLLKKAAGKSIYFVTDIKGKVELNNERGPHKDGTL